MRQRGKLSVFGCVFLAVLAHAAKADDKISFGVGLGAAYGGVGINVARITAGNMYYGAVGCYAYSTGEKDAACGGALGWISTNLFAQANDQHGIGVVIGAVGAENNSSGLNAVYGGGVTYTYFFSGLNQRGANVGAGIAGGDYKRGVDSILLIQLGIQF
ncbi:MAG: hypothetical protein HY273_07400 [Gammaproteobacteria bacterium]|nr:hypothetical protein [Gammaproteobacteria bacterium]